MSTPTFLGPLIGKGVGQCELVNAEHGSVLASCVEPAFDSKTRKKGLLGRDSIPDDYALIIAPCSAVHTFGMRTPLDLVFVAKNGTITKTCRGVQPWRMAGSLRAHAVVEAAPGFIDRHEIVPGEVVALREAAGARQDEAGRVAVRATPSGRSTPAAAAARTASPRHTTRKRVTLADIVARKVSIAWFEGVAIVQELCAEVLAHGDLSRQRVPELKGIALTADGRIALSGEGPAAQWLVHRAGAVLLALVPEDQLPLQLRLLALQEVSPKPKFGSLRELSTELEFFERPDRRDIIRGVYDRYQELSAPGVLSVPVPLPLLEPPPPRAARRSWWRRKGARAAAAMALLAVAVLAFAWEWRRPTGQWLRDDTTRASASVVEAARWARQRGAEGLVAAQTAIRGAKDAPKMPGPGVSFVDPSGPSTPPKPAGPDPLPAQPIPGAAQADAAAGTPPVGLPGRVESSIWEAVGWVPGTIPPLAAPPGDESAIFTSADSRVVPAGLVRPSVPRGDSDQAALPEVELVVSTTGEVESVRLVSPGVGAKTAMMLSAVKAWRFQPATLNGEPVRFRFRMKLIG